MTCGSSRRSFPSQSRRWKRSPVAVQSNRCGERVVAKKKELVMGEVKILKRGEPLSQIDRKEEEDSDLVIGSTDRMGPDPKMMQKEIKAAEFKVMDLIYAGSGAYYASPPPSSVPLPAFLARNVAATSDLCRLLRLQLIAFGEELTYDYRYRLLPGEGRLCHCGVPRCRGRLY